MTFPGDYEHATVRVEPDLLSTCRVVELTNESSPRSDLSFRWVRWNP